MRSDWRGTIDNTVLCHEAIDTMGVFAQVLPCYWEKLRFIKLISEFMEKVELLTCVHIQQFLVHKVRKCEYLSLNEE